MEPLCSLQRFPAPFSLPAVRWLCTSLRVPQGGCARRHRCKLPFLFGVPRGEERQEGKTAPVPWASSAAFLSPETRKKSVSEICSVQNPKCLTILCGCLLGLVLAFSYVKDRIISGDFFHMHVLNGLESV